MYADESSDVRDSNVTRVTRADSKAGKYVPMLAREVYNEKDEAKKLNLKGFAVGDGVLGNVRKSIFRRLKENKKTRVSKLALVLPALSSRGLHSGFPMHADVCTCAIAMTACMHAKDDFGNGWNFYYVEFFHGHGQFSDLLYG